MSVVKPMLATEADLAKLVFPVYATPKLDGVRAMILKHGVMSRSWKLIPNEGVQLHFGRSRLFGLDGELIVGSPTATDVYRQTQSVTARANGGCMNVTFYAFDLVGLEDATYEQRLYALHDRVDEAGIANVKVVPSVLCRSLGALESFETAMLDEGYEGLILRSPQGMYKHGRSTVKEGGMLKLKRFSDSEAVVLGVEEELENQNEAKRDAYGRTERSSHKDNLIGKNRMGALIVKDIHTGVEFKIGTGFTAADREEWWQWFKGQPAGKLPAVVVKYKSFAIGVKDKPRFPVYLGLREAFDR